MTNPDSDKTAATQLTYDEQLVQLARDEIQTRRLNRVEACKTYVEQTKLLVTLASAFVVAPAAIVALDPARLTILRLHSCIVIAAECSFLLSVFSAYFVLGSLAGSQYKGTLNVYRPFTVFASLVQLVAYIVGLSEVVWLVKSLVGGAA